jgi:hypothetical protein
LTTSTAYGHEARVTMSQRCFYVRTVTYLWHLGAIWT